MDDQCECACSEYCVRPECDGDCECFPCPACHPLWFELDDAAEESDG